MYVVRKNSNMKLQLNLRMPSSWMYLERYKQGRSSGAWRIRHPMQIRLESHQKQPRPTLWWSRRSSVSSRYRSLSSRCPSNSSTCGSVTTLTTSLSSRSSLWQGKFTQSSKTHRLQSRWVIACSWVARLTWFPDSIKWYWRLKKLIDRNLPRPLSCQNSARNRPRTSVDLSWIRKKWNDFMHLSLMWKSIRSSSWRDNPTASLPTWTLKSSRLLPTSNQCWASSPHGELKSWIASWPAAVPERPFQIPWW